jgi:N-acetylglucosaminyldiphosphoundecaprenol N-acetyl-beta-D-mannosaminyltransferase
MTDTTETLTVVNCAGVPITACTPTEAAHEVIRLATSELHTGVDVHLCNAYTLALADKNTALKAMLQQASINFPDGKSVVWANKMLHRRLSIPSQRVYGPDLLLDVFDHGQAQDLRHYLLGSTIEVLASMKDELRRRYPRAVIAGSESPPFRSLTNDEQVAQRQRILDASPDIVWVGLGTPKQDVEIAGMARRLPLVFVAVGAAFDFVAGTKKQAPMWMQKNGFEWIHRFASEPRRLWRRYFFGNVRFVAAALRGR